MVAEEGVDLPAGSGGLLLQPHDEVDDAHAIRAMVDEVANKPERMPPAAPVLIVVYQTRILEKIDEPGQMPMYIPDNIRITHTRFPASVYEAGVQRKNGSRFAPRMVPSVW